MKAWFYALITKVKPYLGNDKWIKINHNETLMRWKDSHIERLEKEYPFAFHLCLVMNSYLDSNLKSHNLFCENHLGKGLWNIKEIISVFSSWDHIYIINLTCFDKKPWVYSKKRRPKSPKEDRYPWSFLLMWWTMMSFNYAYEFYVRYWSSKWSETSLWISHVPFPLM